MEVFLIAASCVASFWLGFYFGKKAMLYVCLQVLEDEAKKQQKNRLKDFQ